jgi:hypothetical protein
MKRIRPLRSAILTFLVLLVAMASMPSAAQGIYPSGVFSPGQQQ